MLRLGILAVITSATLTWADQPKWAYSGKAGPPAWGKLDGAYAACGLGKVQSPINIVTKAVVHNPLPAIEFSYQPSAGTVVNTGRTIQVNLVNGGSAVIDGTTYSLVQFHFHTPSEERIDGKVHLLNAHLVHKDSNGNLAVVGLLYNVGKENTVLAPIFDAFPKQTDDKVELTSAFNAADLLPQSQKYYAFEGSLTTPPCSENVKWRVMETEITLSAAQLAKFRARYAMNARPAQPLNGRIVQASQ